MNDGGRVRRTSKAYSASQHGFLKVIHQTGVVSSGLPPEAKGPASSGKHYAKFKCKSSPSMLRTYNRLANRLPTGSQPHCGHMEVSQLPDTTSPFESPPKIPSDSIFQNQICDFSFPDSSSTIHLETRPRRYLDSFSRHPSISIPSPNLWVSPSKYFSNQPHPSLHLPLQYLSPGPVW